MKKLTEKQAFLRLQELAKLLNNYSYYYYEKSQSIVDDYTFDKLTKENTLLEKKFPHLKRSNSPSLKIGAQVSLKKNKINYSLPMLSLENAYTFSDIKKFITRIKKDLNITAFPDMIGEFKIDGVSAQARYENGIITALSTRGNGHIGENVSDKVPFIQNLPQQLQGNFPLILEIRGEIYVDKQDFISFNLQHDNQFSNPRNFASGSLKQLKSENIKKRKLKFFAYEIGFCNENFAITATETRDKLKNFGFKLSESQHIKNEKSIQNFYKQISMNRYELSYDIDGLVFKLNLIKYRNILASSTKYPRWAIAYKFQAKTAITKLLDIKLQVGRSGVITPVAILNPINIGGVIVARASLYNKLQLEKKDIRIGDKVEVQRAGDVIPKVLAPIKDKQHDVLASFIYPITCPSCGYRLVFSNDGKLVQCPNQKNCQAQIIQRITHFASKEALDIEGFNIATVKEFYKLGILKSYIDIFYLKDKQTQILNLSGWNKVSFNKLLAAIKKSKDINLSNFLVALGIPSIGINLANILAKNYISLSNFISKISDAKIELHNKSTIAPYSQQLASIDKIGKITKIEIINFITNEVIKHNINILSEILNIKDYSPITGPLAEENVVFSGKLNTMSRNRAKELATTMGAITNNQISNTTTMLIKGEGDFSKIKIAQRKGIKIINEQKWLAILEKYK